MASPTVAQIDERIASAERDYRKLLASLRSDRREAVARERQADREFQRQVRDWIGELVLAQCAGGWRAVDPAALEAAIVRALAGLEPIDEMTLDEAQAAWRKWRRRAGEKESPATADDKPAAGEATPAAPGTPKPEAPVPS